METMTTLDMLGVWCGILLTIIVLSFLFDDNPLYKFAEHLFMDWQRTEWSRRGTPL